MRLCISRVEIYKGEDENEGGTWGQWGNYILSEDLLSRSESQEKEKTDRGLRGKRERPVGVGKKNFSHKKQRR